MDEENTSPIDSNEAVETPESDPILDVLSDTEDTEAPAKAEEVVETPDEEESEPEAEPEAEPTNEETEEVEPAVDPKEEARRRYEERQLAQRESQERVQQVAQEHIKGAEDEYDQRLRTMEANDFARLVQHNENTLINEFETAKQNPDLQIFNPESDQFNQKAYDKALRDFNAGYIGYDQNGNMTEIRGSLIEHLTETSDLLQGAVKSGAVQQVKAVRKMQTNADSKPAATPKEPQKDPILEVLMSD